jgi:predicted PhzF superfamily epimerase YddE/YHI9/GNAT superfamily N-acetyltransferase
VSTAFFSPEKLLCRHRSFSHPAIPSLLCCFVALRIASVVHHRCVCLCSLQTHSRVHTQYRSSIRNTSQLAVAIMEDPPTPLPSSSMMSTASTASSTRSRITFRQVIPADIPACFAIETASYPKDEAATKSSMQYRQHHAEKYFRCAVLNIDEDDETIVGFICATRCQRFTEESMLTHDTTGTLLAIHSVVVSPDYRHLGIATAMMEDYHQTLETLNPDDGVEKFVLMCKAELLVFYVLHCGYAVVGPSDIVHGKDQWYHLERSKQNVGNKKKQSTPCWVVDSFTTVAGKGNPAAVVLLEQAPDCNDAATIEWFQTVAREFNLSETAFCWKLSSADSDASIEETGNSSSSNLSAGDSEAPPATNGDKATPKTADDENKYRIKYFTVNGTEVDLCGHATLAAAAVLFQNVEPSTDASASSSIVFCANKDELIMTPCDTKYLSSNATNKAMPISMNFPQKMVTELMDEDYSAVVNMLERAFPSIAPDVIEASVLYIGLDQDGNDVLVELTPECLASLPHTGIKYDELDWPDYNRGVILCCVVPDDDDDADSHDGDDDVDFYSRFFGPKAGIGEDPVTGSAHCTLAPYFGQKLNQMVLKAEQTSFRGGTVECTLLESDANNDRRVNLVGSAVITLSGSSWI